ncbi:glycosyltransferase, partial [Candidatus Woesearchaeota archaeon]|nr:glycosyltransferase [Candidatus Woesearchaeota archaeon]
LFGEEPMQELKRKVIRLVKNKTSLPMLCTHNLNDEGGDPILNGFRSHGLLNRQEDRVKVVLYPIYLTGADRLLDLTYYEAMTGSHLGVFPSYYEPWGYTPLEAAGLGVVAITTDCAGFGRYITQKSALSPYPGVYVLNRLKNSYNESVEQLSRILFEYCNFTKQERIENKIQARRIASYADWKLLIDNYIRAHNLAVGKVWN